MCQGNTPLFPVPEPCPKGVLGSVRFIRYPDRRPGRDGPLTGHVKLMTLAENLHAIYRRGATRSPDALSNWRDAWYEAFETAYFILADRELAMDTAHDAVVALDEDRARRWHRAVNMKYYHSGQGDHSILRKPVLGDDQHLDLLVLRYATNYELKKAERDEATRDDLDVWFIKCVIEHCYYSRSNRLQPAVALHLAVAVSAVLHDYRIEVDVPAIWGKLTMLVPRAYEIHKEGEEPFREYLLRLFQTIKRRFPGLILNDGRSGIRRRTPDPHARELTARCFNRFELRGTRNYCLPVRPPAGDDNVAETRRLHAFTHLECYEFILQQLSLQRKDRATLAAFNVTNDRRGGDTERRPAPLSPSECRNVEDTLRERLYERKRAVLGILVVTVDDEVQSVVTRELPPRGTASILLPESARMVQIWARQERGPDVLIASRLLTPFTAMADVHLADGRTISFRFADTASAADSVRCDIEIAEPAGILPSARDAMRTVVAVVARGAVFRSVPFIGAAAMITALALVAVQHRRPDPTPADAHTPLMRDSTASVSSSDPASRPIQVPSPETSSQRTVHPPAPVARENPSTRAARPAIRSVYVGDFSIYRDDRLDRQARHNVITQLARSSQFLIVGSSDRADLTINVDSDFRTADGQPVQFRITTKTGEFLSTSPVVQISGDRSDAIGRDAEILHRALTVALERARAAARK
jgi:hypothetical protein